MPCPVVGYCGVRKSGVSRDTLIFVLRLIAVLFCSMTAVHACDCFTPKISKAKKRADIVFRGRITGFRDTGLGYRNIVFAVDRVWKGRVPPTFEMPVFKEQAACLGFWPDFVQVGRHLLVYAYRLGNPPVYFTDICSRTSLVENTKDFAELGLGHKPTSK